MWHNFIWIGGIWLLAIVLSWLICRWRGYNAGTWALTITAFCVGIFVGAENTMHGRSRCPSCQTTITPISYTAWGYTEIAAPASEAQGPLENGRSNSKGVPLLT